MSRAHGGFLPEFDLVIPMPAGAKPPRVDPIERPAAASGARDATRRARRIYRLKRDIAMVFGEARKAAPEP